MQKFGVIEELCIYYHPQTNKHLGLGRVVFETVVGARQCVDKLNDTSVMGRCLQVFLDPFGEKCKKKFEECTVEKKPPPPPPPPLPETPASSEPDKTIKEEEPQVSSKKDKDKDKPPVIDSKSEKKDRYSRSYRDFPTPSSSENMGYTPEFSTPIPPYEYPPPLMAQFPYGTPTYHHPMAPMWPMATPSWPAEHWDRTTAPLPTTKWPPVEKEAVKVVEKKKNHQVAKKKENNHKKREEKDKQPPVIEREDEENSKTLDLDTRIALLLKGRGTGGMAPPFLTLGGDSDDDTKGCFDKMAKSVPIPTSIDSDDGQLLFCFFFFGAF